MKPSAWILMGLLLVLGLTSFIFVRVEAGQGSSLVMAQRSAQRLTVAGVERVVRTAPESEHGPNGRRARCVALGHVGLRNPWRCSITYPDGVRVQYTIQIRLNGSYQGTHPVVYQHGQVSRGLSTISGCCIVVP